MHNVDIIGLENVIKYIQASKLSKFTIQRAGNNGSYMSVFECINSNSNETAVNEFSKWAEVVNNSMPYKIVLFDFAEIITDDTGESKIKKSKSKNGKMESIFIINPSHTYAHPTQQKNETLGFDAVSMRQDIIKELAKQQEENAVLNEIKKLTERLNKIEEEEEEEEEEEKPNTIGGIDMSQMAQIMGLINMFKGSNNPPVINGVEDDKKDNIVKAINILHKNDPLLDIHLLKLADLSINKPDTFKMLIGMLDNM